MILEYRFDHLVDQVVGEIDVDSDHLDAFSSVDREFLEAVAKKVSRVW